MAEVLLGRAGVLLFAFLLCEIAAIEEFLKQLRTLEQLLIPRHGCAHQRTLYEISGTVQFWSSLGPSSGTCLLKVEGIPTAFIKSLFRASAALFRTDPWKRLDLPISSVFALAKILTGLAKSNPSRAPNLLAGMAVILVFTCSNPTSMPKICQASMKPPCHLILNFCGLCSCPNPFCFLPQRGMIKSLSLETASGDRFPVIDVARRTSAGIRFRNPTAEELRYVFAFMKAIALVHSFLQSIDNGMLGRGRLMRFETFIETVDVQWPPELPRAGELIAVTISHPPGQVYQGMKMNLQNSTQSVNYMESGEEAMP